MAYYLYVDNEKKGSLTSFDANEFKSNMQLHIQGNDFSSVQSMFENFSSIAVYKGDTQLLYSESFDGYSNISFYTKVYCQEESKFCNELAVTLTKKNLVDTVNALEAQLNPTIDYASMNLEEAKDAIKTELNTACQKAIYDGIDVTLSDGTIEHFSLTQNDQANISSLASLILQDSAITALPYHSDGKSCKLYDSVSLLTLYMQMQMKITQETTYCNLIKIYVDSLTEKSDVLAIAYGTDLPSDVQATYNEIISASLTIMQELKNKIFGSADSNTDSTTTENSTTDTENTEN